MELSIYVSISAAFFLGCVALIILRIVQGRVNPAESATVVRDEYPKRILNRFYLPAMICSTILIFMFGLVPLFIAMTNPETRNLTLVLILFGLGCLASAVFYSVKKGNLGWSRRGDS